MKPLIAKQSRNRQSTPSAHQTTHNKALTNMSVKKILVCGGAMEDFVLSSGNEAIVKAKAIEFFLQPETESTSATKLTGNHGSMKTQG